MSFYNISLIYLAQHHSPSFPILENIIHFEVLKYNLLCFACNCFDLFLLTFRVTFPSALFKTRYNIRWHLPWFIICSLDEEQFWRAFHRYRTSITPKMHSSLVGDVFLNRSAWKQNQTESICVLYWWLSCPNPTHIHSPFWQQTVLSGCSFFWIASAHH